MQNITPGAWFVIIFLVIFIVTLNIWLFSTARNKSSENSTLNIIKKSTKILQNPFFEENKKLDELANLTKAFKQTAPGDKNSDCGDIYKS